MKMRQILSMLGLLCLVATSFAQVSFPYSVQLTPVSIPNLPGLHSYAFGQSNGKWLIVGGRADGLHPRQPNQSFPANFNNTNLYVIDPVARTAVSASVNNLAPALREHLQATNMQFQQLEDTLYIIGGYAFSASANGHITFQNLTTIVVSQVIAAIESGSPYSPFLQQITNPYFAVTGGHLQYLKGIFYLVGGHRFDGRYNPNNNPTFTQVYSNQIKKFTIRNAPNNLRYVEVANHFDEVHLRRRDYNLVPQIFPDGTQGFTVFSGVFQSTADLPFLYPVDINETGYVPKTNFNQFLSHYHSPKVALFDSVRNQMHTLFFGGMSQFYPEGPNLMRDDRVPFVNTISRVTRYADSSMQEFFFEQTMPGLKGASAEFISNPDLIYTAHGVLKLAQHTHDTLLIGHIMGGIASAAANPFVLNQIAQTSADATVYQVRLLKNVSTKAKPLNGKNPYSFNIQTAKRSEIEFLFQLDKAMTVGCFVSDATGKVIHQEEWLNLQPGEQRQTVKLSQAYKNQVLNLALVFNHKYFATRRVWLR